MGQKVCEIAGVDRVPTERELSVRLTRFLTIGGRRYLVFVVDIAPLWLHCVRPMQILRGIGNFLLKKREQLATCNHTHISFYRPDEISAFNQPQAPNRLKRLFLHLRQPRLLVNCTFTSLIRS
jgi:hypothetical protein